MTVTLDLPPRLFDQVEADARAQGRPVADVVRDAVADWYAGEETASGAADIDADIESDIYETHPLPASLTQPLGDMLRQGFEAADAGRVIDGETFLAELRDRAQALRAG